MWKSQLHVDDMSHRPYLIRTRIVNNAFDSVSSKEAIGQGQSQLLNGYKENKTNPARIRDKQCLLFARRTGKFIDLNNPPGIVGDMA